MFDFLIENPEVLPGLLEEIDIARNLKGSRIEELHKNLENKQSE